MALAAIASVITLGVPAFVAFQNYDDHNRANRYTARDFAFNYLNSCAKEAVIFTNGDNDTFPCGTPRKWKTCVRTYAW